MAKVTIEVTGGIVDGAKKGEQISVEEKSAKYLEKIGYAKIVAKAEKSEPKKEAPKKSTPKKKKAE